jgi:D-alanyl-D-alanine carboxypeptidase (penicillin-binding protein 5/6)
VPLVAETAVEEAGLFQRIADTLARHLTWGGAQTP